MTLRHIDTTSQALLFDPGASMTKRLLDVLGPRMQAKANEQMSGRPERDALRGIDESSLANPPFELEVLEAALMACMTRLDAEALLVGRTTTTTRHSLARMHFHINWANAGRTVAVVAAAVVVACLTQNTGPPWLAVLSTEYPTPLATLLLSQPAFSGTPGVQLSCRRRLGASAGAPHLSLTMNISIVLTVGYHANLLQPRCTSCA